MKYGTVRKKQRRAISLDKSTPSLPDFLDSPPSRKCTSCGVNPVQSGVKTMDWCTHDLTKRFEMKTEAKSVTIYTDGACLRNPGAGGYAVVIAHGKHRKELSGGYRKTSNNRMEIMAAIVGLEALKERCVVSLYTDSKYLQQSISLG
jgi:hypothetical protein